MLYHMLHAAAHVACCITCCMLQHMVRMLHAAAHVAYCITDYPAGWTTDAEINPYYWGNSAPIGDASPCSNVGINGQNISFPLNAKFKNRLTCINDDPMVISSYSEVFDSTLYEGTESGTLRNTAFKSPYNGSGHSQVLGMAITR